MEYGPGADGTKDRFQWIQIKLNCLTDWNETLITKCRNGSDRLVKITSIYTANVSMWLWYNIRWWKLNETIFFSGIVRKWTKFENGNHSSLIKVINFTRYIVSSDKSRKYLRLFRLGKKVNREDGRKIQFQVSQMEWSVLISVLDHMATQSITYT